jgi:hypothetical protein
LWRYGDDTSQTITGGFYFFKPFETFLYQGFQPLETNPSYPYIINIRRKRPPRAFFAGTVPAKSECVPDTHGHIWPHKQQREKKREGKPSQLLHVIDFQPSSKVPHRQGVKP